jgi:hypothetical protein
MAASAVWLPGAGAASSAGVTMSPSGPYRGGQSVRVSVGPNSLFTPHLRVIMLECADPGGSTANLPTSVKQCDGNTVQGDSVIVQADGSFSESAYTVFSLPNQALAEDPSGQPVCNATSPCVLYVGLNQEDFTQPKVFSTPFVVTPVSGATPSGSSNSGTPAATGSPSTPTAGGSPGAAGGGSGGTGAASGPASADASVSLAGAGQLAFTGPPVELRSVLFVGGLLVMLGSVGRLLVRRSWA